jgi:hypothetical protein
MAQHDYIIANQSGAGFRSDLNNGLAAIVSQNSGAAEPSTTYAYQWWADTTTGLLKIRNAANNAWITIGTLASANLGLLSLAGGTLTGALLVDDSGTAALPAIAFDGDTNTGIFSPGADQLGIATNGVERVEFGTTEVVFNDGGADVDFRIEGDTKANLFKVDAGADTVIIDGLTHPSADGTADQAVVTNGSGVLSFASRSRLISGTSVASTSGTSIDFTGLPSWVKRITVMLDGVSTNGTSPVIVQLGDSGGVENTGYVSQAAGISTTVIDTTRSGTNTDGFRLAVNVHAASDAITGKIDIVNISSNTWIAQGIIIAAANFPTITVGSKTTSATLDRVRITTVGGTDTFDAGSINILYEG